MDLGYQTSQRHSLLEFLEAFIDDLQNVRLVGVGCLSLKLWHGRAAAQGTLCLSERGSAARFHQTYQEQIRSISKVGSARKSEML